MKYLKKILCVVMGFLLLIVSMPMAMTVHAGPVATIEFGHVVSQPGTEVEVPVCIKNNPGISTFRFRIYFDSSAMSLVDVANGSLLTSGSIAKKANDAEQFATFLWYTVDGDIYGDGEIARLKFHLSNELEGKFPIKVAAGTEDIVNAELQPIPFAVQNGSVSISEVSEIEMDAMPTKLSYLEAKDELNLTGGKINVHYAIGSSQIVELSKATITGFNNKIIGRQTLTVTYMNKQTMFDVTVVPKSLQAISVHTLPFKTQYLEAKDGLDLTGGKLTLSYNNDTTEEINMSSAKVTGFDNRKTGRQLLTITYQEQSTTFFITVVPKSIAFIQIAEKPLKLKYTEGADFESAGMKVKVIYDNGSEEIITSGWTETYDFSKPGQQTVTITYGGQKTTLDVTVNSRIPSSITSDKYLVKDGRISKIPVGTTVKTLLAGIHEGKYCHVYKGSKELSASAVVGTGMTVKLMDGSKVIAQVTTVVTGDVNGDGTISITDMIAIKAHILKKNLVKDVFAVAADTNGDGGISITDFIQTKAHILGKAPIKAR